MAFDLKHHCALTCIIFASLLTLSVSISPKIIDEVVLWQSNEAGFTYFRIPVVIRIPNGDLLAFSGAHKSSLSDIDAKGLAMRRSTDTGYSWKPMEIIYEDLSVKEGYLNIGAALVDHDKNITMFLYCHCPHRQCGPGVIPANYIIKSHDFGYTWSEPEDLSVKNPAFKNWTWCPGPGYGIQKRFDPAKGRLIVCGHTVDRNKQASEIVYCVHSDDHGSSWQIGGSLVGVPYKVPKKTGDFMPDESQIVELSDGSLLMNSRNQFHFHCLCRIISRSFDGGLSFPMPHVKVDPKLIDPACDGSIIIHKGIMFFSNPASTKGRENMTVRWSLNNGTSWEGALFVFPGNSEYSTLTEIDSNSIGLLYEKNNYKEVSFVKIQIH
ncbi:sialidase-1-like [Ptychodera flava]|uniref:sialidase-1-like n=1 Tax=Ptychodera flava TaxID=63121 RepID=UPI00396A4948